MLRAVRAGQPPPRPDLCTRATLFELAGPLPDPDLIHLVAPQRPRLDREERGYVAPVLEDLPPSDRVLYKVLLMGTEASKRSEVMGSLQNIYRVDLVHTDRAEVLNIDLAPGSRRVEALNTDGDAPGTLQRDLPHSPVKFGSRFSKNAATASAKSLVRNMGSS